PSADKSFGLMPLKLDDKARELLRELNNTFTVAKEYEEVSSRAVLIYDRLATWCHPAIVQLGKFTLTIEEEFKMANGLEKSRWVLHSDQITMKAKAEVLTPFHTQRLGTSGLDKQRQ